MKSTLLSRRDLDFLLYEWLRVDELTKRERFAEHSRETFDGVLDLCEQLAARYFAPHNKKSDANEPSFDGERVTVIGEVKEAWDAFAAADLMAMSMDQDLGGAQLPTTVADAAFAWFSAANVSTTGYLMLTMANANLLAKFGTRGADRGLPQADARGPILRDDGAVGDPGGLVARRHPHPCRTTGRRHLPAVRVQDVDLRRGTRTDREHRQPGARQDPGRAARHEGHLAVHRAEVRRRRRRFGR